MPESVLLFIGIVVVLVVALVTVNVAIVRSSARKTDDSPETRQTRKATITPSPSQTPNGQMDDASQSHSEMSQKSSTSTENSTANANVEDSSAYKSGHTARFGLSGSNAEAVPSVPLEVVQDHHGSGHSRIFHRPNLPYRLFAHLVPIFAEENWKACFAHLTDDPTVLGWLAFQDDRLGAADIEYDDDFVKVLLTYREALDKLRNEVGLSTIQQSSMVGDEGKMWMVTAAGGVWLVLFVDRHTDFQQLSNHIIPMVEEAKNDDMLV